MLNVMRSVLGLIWSAISCLVALILALMSKKFIPFVLTRIGSQMWSANMLRISGINRPVVTFVSD